MAMFDSRGDFSGLADVSRVRDSDIAMSILPEKAGEGQKAASLKDVAFIYAAVAERGIIDGWGPMENRGGLWDYINYGVVTPRALIADGRSVLVREDGFYGPVAAIGGLAKTGVDVPARWARGWFDFDFLDIDKLEGRVVDLLTDPDPDAATYEKMIAPIFGKEDKPNSSESAYLAAPATPPAGAPFAYPLDFVKNIYYFLKHATGHVYHTETVTVVDYSLMTNYEIVNETCDAQGNITVTTDSRTESTFRLVYSDYLEWDVYFDGSYYKTTQRGTAGFGGAHFRYTVRVGASVVNLVRDAYLVFESYADSEMQISTGQHITYVDKKKLHVVHVSAPSSVDANNGIVNFEVAVSDIAQNMLEKPALEPPEMPPRGERASSYAGTAVDCNAATVFLRFSNLRTSLDDVAFDYAPDPTKTLP